MTVREEVVLFLLVLLSLGLLVYGVLDLAWPRAQRARRLRRVRAERRARHLRRGRDAHRAPYVRRSRAEDAPPIPTVVAPPLPAPPSPTPGLSVEEILEQIKYLLDFPLRALVLLRRADAQLVDMPDDVRTDAMRRRLDAARAAVGYRLVEAGLTEQALAPLIQVVGRTSLAGEDLQHARETLVAALTTISEQRAQATRRLAQDGNQASAILHAERLATLMRNAIDAGLTEGELAAPLATAQRLFGQLGVHRIVVAR